MGAGRAGGTVGAADIGLLVDALRAARAEVAGSADGCLAVADAAGADFGGSKEFAGVAAAFGPTNRVGEGGRGAGVDVGIAVDGAETDTADDVDADLEVALAAGVEL
jgi:hypothetical protein